MNKRFAMLKQQAVSYPDWEEKFAELLVQTCIKQCRSVGTIINSIHGGEAGRKYSSVALSCEKLIKEHFGIKE